MMLCDIISNVLINSAHYIDIDLSKTVLHIPVKFLIYYEGPELKLNAQILQMKVMELIKVLTVTLFWSLFSQSKVGLQKSF
jgi:hypothetical protein